MGEAHKLTEAQARTLQQIIDMESAGEPACTLGANNGPDGHAALKRNGLIVGEKRPYIDSRMSWKRGYPWLWRATDAGRAALARHRGETK